jgi:hypothetical protein
MLSPVKAKSKILVCVVSAQKQCDTPPGMTFLQSPSGLHALVKLAASSENAFLILPGMTSF